MSRVDEDTDGEKDGDWKVDEQAVRHLFDFSFLPSLEKLFGVGNLVQRLRV